MAKTIRSPEINQPIFVIVKGSQTAYNRLHHYNKCTGHPFTVKRRWPFCIEAVDCEGHEWRFPTVSFSFINPYVVKQPPSKALSPSG